MAILGSIWPIPRGFTVPQNRSGPDIGTCLESPLMAIPGHPDHVQERSGLPPTSDIPVLMSGFGLIAAGYGSELDVPETSS